MAGLNKRMMGMDRFGGIEEMDIGQTHYGF